MRLVGSFVETPDSGLCTYVVRTGTVDLQGGGGSRSDDDFATPARFTPRDAALRPHQTLITWEVPGGRSWPPALCWPACRLRLRQRRLTGPSVGCVAKMRVTVPTPRAWRKRGIAAGVLLETTLLLSASAGSGGFLTQR